MKLPNLEKVKKMKPGGNKLPGPKRFHIKNRFLQKNLLSLIVVAVLAIGTGTAYGTLSSHAVDRGKDPVNGVNKDRYQVLVSGKGYKLTPVKKLTQVGQCACKERVTRQHLH